MITRQLLRFAIVGVAGFAIDAGVLTALVASCGFKPYPARAISFPLAVLGTWLLNRNWTFAGLRATNVGAEYLRYMVVQILGAISNLAIFVLVLESIPPLARYPAIPLAFGALAGLIVNFAGTRAFVFVDRFAVRSAQERIGR